MYEWKVYIDRYIFCYLEICFKVTQELIEEVLANCENGEWQQNIKILCIDYRDYQHGAVVGSYTY